MHIQSYLWRMVLLVAVLLTACTGFPQLPGPAPTSTPAPPPTLTATPLPIPTATLTPTPRPLVSLPSDGLPHYSMLITLDYAGRTIEAAQRVQFYNASSDLWTEVVFAVAPAATAGAFALSAAEVTTEWTRQAMAYTLDGTMLHIQLPTPVRPGAPLEVYLSFRLVLPAVATTDWPPVGNLGASDRLIQVGDWYPTLVPYKSGSGWQTWIYHPVGDPTIYEVATYDAEILVEPGIIIAAAGEQPSAGVQHTYHLERARSFAFFASPEYHVIERTAGNIPVRSYFLPEYSAAGLVTLETAQKSLEYFSTIYGPYPYPMLVIAQNGYYGGMEYAGLVSVSGYAYESYAEQPYDLLVSLTAHEIAHQWWYGAVGNDQVHEPWLDEALAKYSELLFYERFYPSWVDWWWENHVNQWSATTSLNDSIYEFTDTPTYIHEIYGRGARFLDDLRRQMGEEAFFAFLRDYRMRGDGRLMTQQDFFNVLATHTAEDLSGLRQTYFAP